MKEWWDKLPDSTKRSLKTLWQAFFGTFMMTLCTGLLNGWPGWDSFQSLVFAAGSAAIAAVAAKVVNYYYHERGEVDAKHAKQPPADGEGSK